ncbi:DUF4126 family protein [Altericroceibacterium xinjiangense]|uniref:DUF4126 family protein n=1 Tax=Altericroceibacterium xinjiangense TaxID=762261 RepID=UPI0013E0CBC7|nr:DUF4126 family protein [Altericroceibacterium xinjiangense]
MRASFLMGLVGGQRALTPLASVAVASARDELTADNRLTRFLGHPLIAAGAVALAVAEMVGDKQKSAPDRIVPIGLAARFVTSAIAGAALAPRRERWLGALIGGGTALAASYVGWRIRIRAMEEYGQTATGFVEDTAVLASAAAIVRS